MNQKTHTFASRVLGLLCEMGITDIADQLEYLEKHTGKPRSSITYMIQQKSKPGTVPQGSVVKIYADALGVDPGVLTGDV